MINNSHLVINKIERSVGELGVGELRNYRLWSVSAIFERLILLIALSILYNSSIKLFSFRLSRVISLMYLYRKFKSRKNNLVLLLNNTSEYTNALTENTCRGVNAVKLFDTAFFFIIIKL